MRVLCKLLDPIMDMLQMVDSDTRQIGKILCRYDEMIVRCLSACTALEKDEQDALLEVFDRRRTMFKSPAHVTVMMLDPEFRDRTMPDEEEMQHGLKLALIQFGYPEHSNQHNEVLTAIDKFHYREPLPRGGGVGGRGGGRRASRGRGGRGGPGGRSVTSRRMTVAELVRKPRQRWDEGDFLYESSSSDDEDFFGTGRTAQDDDNDIDNRHPDVDDDDGVRDDDRGDGGDRPRPRSTRTDADRGPDEGARHCHDEGGAGLTRERDIVRMRVALMHEAAEGPGDLQMVTPCTTTGQEASTAQSRMTLEGPRDLQMVTPCEATGQEASAAHTAHRSFSDSFDGPEQAPMGGAVDTVERPATPPRSPSNSEHHPDSAVVGVVTGVPATNTADATRQPLVGSSSWRDTTTVLATAAFYVSGSSVGGLDEQGVRIVGRPCAPSMGTRSIGTVDGARHTAMTYYEERYGSALPTKTSDVHATKAAKATLSRAKKRASERKASRSSPHMRSGIGRSGVVHIEDGEIAPDGDALDVGGRAATTADSVAMDGAGDGVAGQKRRGGVLIVHDDNTDVAPGETTGTDDAGDSDYVPTGPKPRGADGDDGGGW
ncbi:hypothetical protein CBR_g28736 [Chara braunii]|uniref:Uncharacterized protein n=1 Tax=Chara braunii TaxID=69332 RepID=A0A388LA13_CHABU|nr:hypothetical protein CBR_g28736 [Chara braunii]|eukprot:GBG79023.1 hypothetical protein CBR_g28736 [Chara braunii]